MTQEEIKKKILEIATPLDGMTLEEVFIILTHFVAYNIIYSCKVNHEEVVDWFSELVKSEIKSGLASIKRKEVNE